MPIVNIDQIKVDQRQRENYGDLPDLANSLADPKFGQLAPIRINRDNRLVAGGRRLAAAALLSASGGSIAGLSTGVIWAEYIDTISPEHAEQIELEENIRRLQLGWQEEQKAIAKLHGYRIKEDPTWTADKTAEIIGKKRRSVYNAIELSKALDQHPDIAAADTAQGAMLRLTRIKDLASRESDIRVAALAQGLGYSPKVQAQVVHGDALEGMQNLQSESVDGVIFNPPFGVDIESLFTSGRKIYANDGAIEMTRLTELIVEQAYRVLKPDRWMVMFYPTARLEDVKGIDEPMWKAIERVLDDLFHEHYVETDVILHGLKAKLKERLANATAGMLQRHGFTFQTVPCQWVKPNKRVSSLGDPYAQININYETFYFARKGKAQLRQIPPFDCFVVDTPSADRIHPLEMPVELWTNILAAICVGGEKVVEPFAGSGSGGEAAVALGINYLGWELDRDFALHAETRLVGCLAGVMGKKPEAPAKHSPLKLVTGPGGIVTIDTTDLDSSVFDDE